MATQLQRALGISEGKEPMPKRDAIKESTGRSERRADKKGNGKKDPYTNLPRRVFAVDKEG